MAENKGKKKNEFPEKNHSSVCIRSFDDVVHVYVRIIRWTG